MQNQFVDIYRNGIRTAADVARLSLESTIRMQEKSLEMARGFLNEQARSAEEITGARSMEELLSVQSRFAGAQVGRMVEFWSSLWQTAAQNQAQGLREIQTFAARGSEDAANQERKARKSA